MIPDVSIHVPTRGTTTCNAPNVGYSQFQSTFPRGERHFFFIDALSSSMFQSTFPRGERLATFQPLRAGVMFQSTFPRGERPPARVPLECRRSVSIHVPTRGTTRAGSDPCRQSSPVSIHVPTRGTTEV